MMYYVYRLSNSPTNFGYYVAENRPLPSGKNKVRGVQRVPVPMIWSGESTDPDSALATAKANEPDWSFGETDE